MEMFQPLMDLLSGQHGRLAAVAGWMAAARVALKPFNLALLGWLNRVVIYIHNTPEKDDDALLLRVMEHWAWRLFAGLVDTFTTLKVPTTATIRGQLGLSASPVADKSWGAILLLLGAFTAVSLQPGCALLPGADPVVVNAERVTTVAVEVFDAFLQYEFNNRAALADTPQVRRAADAIRAHGIEWLQTSRALTKAYKANRTPENKAGVESAVAVLSAAVAEAQVYLGRAAASPAGQ